MTIQRRFLHGNTPALRQAVAYLREHHPPTQPWDLHNLIIAVPGQRAVRRLIELLVESAGDAGLLPPTILTTGQLPDELCETATPVVSDLIANLTWIEAAKSTPELAALLPHPPDDRDLSAWWPLASQFRRTAADLSAADHPPSQIPDVCDALSIPLPQPERWLALAAICDRHEALLQQRSLVESHTARRTALQEGRFRAVGPVILLGVIDMTPLLADMLRLIDADVTALIHASEDLADAFDDLGTLIVDEWFDRPIDIDEDRLHIVDRPFDQGRQAAVVIDAHARPKTPGAPHSLTVEDITIGLGDESDVDAIRRPLELAGLRTRYAAGRPMSQSSPVVLLAALAKLAKHRRLSDLSDLLRHSDVETWLHTNADDDANWLTILDEYSSEHLQDLITGRWLGRSSRAGRLDLLWRRISSMLPPDSEEIRPLPDWCENILDALRHIYGSMSFEREHDGPRATLRALERLATLINEHQQLEPTDSSTPAVTFSVAIGQLLKRLEDETIPEEVGAPAVELLGFLELPLDDARELVIMGFNEGRVPTSRGPDPLLPDQLRQTLGLDHNRRRYARAACALAAILHSERAVTLIAGRWTSDHEPLLPSRLLLACDDATRVHRLNAFYRDDIETPSSAPLLLVPSDDSHFFPPPPLVDDNTPLPARLSVTAFRDYIACPYRFYLRRVLRLEGSAEPGAEMDGALFGMLAHDVLQAFGESSEATSQNPNVIEDCLLHALREIAEAHFGDQPRPSVSVQLDQLRLRLHHFSRVQADLVAEGWQIHQIELNHRVPFDVDGEPFTLSGRIDRIDVHPDHGARIVDYKTSDTARTPEQTHRRARAEWLDLQLPLYRELARPLGLQAPVELAYFNLPRRPEEFKLHGAEWTEDEVDEAVEKARDVIRRVRNRVFWPPGDPSHYGDEFSRLCADHALNRTELIEMASRHRDMGTV